MSMVERNPALCIRCTSDWRRWVRQRSRQFGINESALIELACSWYAHRVEFPVPSPAIWYPEIAPRWIDPDEDKYIDRALYLNVTTDWKQWVSDLARSQRRSTSYLIEEALGAYSLAQGTAAPPPRTKCYTQVLR